MARLSWEEAARISKDSGRLLCVCPGWDDPKTTMEWDSDRQSFTLEPVKCLRLYEGLARGRDGVWTWRFLALLKGTSGWEAREHWGLSLTDPFKWERRAREAGLLATRKVLKRGKEVDRILLSGRDDFAYFNAVLCSGG